jgi:hypothetical protein
VDAAASIFVALSPLSRVHADSVAATQASSKGLAAAKWTRAVVSGAECRLADAARGRSCRGETRHLAHRGKATTAGMNPQAAVFGDSNADERKKRERGGGGGGDKVADCIGRW